MQLGMGKLEPDALVFCKYDGTPLDADYLARRWRRAIAEIEGVPQGNPALVATHSLFRTNRGRP